MASCKGKWVHTDDDNNNTDHTDYGYKGNDINNTGDVVCAIRGIGPCGYLWASQLHL